MPCPPNTYVGVSDRLRRAFERHPTERRLPRSSEAVLTETARELKPKPSGRLRRGWQAELVRRPAKEPGRLSTEQPSKQFSRLLAEQLGGLLSGLSARLFSGQPVEQLSRQLPEQLAEFLSRELAE